MELKTSYEHLRLVAAVFNGGIAGLAGISVTFPLDLSKTRLQNQPIVDGKKMYNSMIDCICKISRNEGFRALYKGFAPNIVGIVPEKAIKLTVNDILRRNLSSDGIKISFGNQLVAAAGAGMGQVVITAPMEMLKIHGQDAGRINALSQNSMTSVKSPLMYVYRQYGILGFYRGACATLLRDVPFSMIYFPLFAYLSKCGYEDGSTGVPFRYTLCFGMFSGCTAAMIVNPMDVMKTRLQSIHQTTHRYNGIVHCFRSIYKEEGLRSFMRGAIPRATAVGPLFGIAQGVYYFGVGETVLGIPKLRPV